MSANEEYFVLNFHMEKINAMVKNYLAPYKLDYLDYDGLSSKLEDEYTRAVKRVSPKAMALGGDLLAKVRIKLTEEYMEWKKRNNWT